MGVTAKVKGFARFERNGVNFSRTTIDPGAAANQDSVHYSDAGDDSQPLEDDLVATSSNLETNGQNAVGYVDPKNAGIALPGEKRIYSRDTDGNIKASFYLQADGTIILANEIATITIDPAGNFDFTGGTFTINGQVFADHEHNAGANLLDSVAGTCTGKTGDVV